MKKDIEKEKKKVSIKTLNVGNYDANCVAVFDSALRFIERFLSLYMCTSIDKCVNCVRSVQCTFVKIG